MLAVPLVFGSFLIVLTAILFGMLGWVLREYMFYHHDKPNINPPSHPEMYDEDGNIIPESLIAFRFDPTTMFEDDDD
tara:strand:+ start:934 stop:1164 length:231 start_codon:yes stop_codon:yes gene_type:complete